jgi:hypothetical protein
LVVPPPRGQIMGTLIPPRRARKTKDWLERAKLVVAAARDRAIEKTARQRAEPSTERPSYPCHRRRLAEMSSAKS